MAFVAVGLALVVFGGYVFWGGNAAGDQAAAQILQRASEQLDEPRSADSAPAAPSTATPTATSARGQSVHAPEAQQPAPPASEYAHGDVVGVVSIPSIDAELPVLEGVDAEVLDQGVLGHYPGTAGPGSVGNFAVAGHRTTHGAPLYDVDQIEVGDPIVLQTPRGWDVYTTDHRRIVEPDAVEVIAPVPDEPGANATQRRIVLTSCHPKLSAAQRMVVYATFDRHVTRSQGPPAELGPTAG